jgi:ATP-dependent helicase/nuclease subunit A
MVDQRRRGRERGVTEADPAAHRRRPRRSAFVTANAGSGKTKTLIDRVARLLLEKTKPEAILCVTYTKAAAAEMQRRLFERARRLVGHADADLRKELSELEGAPARLRRRDLSEARALFAQRPGNAGRAEDPDHPRLLRKAAAALSAGGRGLAGLRGDGRLRRAAVARAARAPWRPMSTPTTIRSPRPMPGSRWPWTSRPSSRCSARSRSGAARSPTIWPARRPLRRDRRRLARLRLRRPTDPEAVAAEAMDELDPASGEPAPVLLESSGKAPTPNAPPRLRVTLASRDPRRRPCALFTERAKARKHLGRQDLRASRPRGPARGLLAEQDRLSFVREQVRAAGWRRHRRRPALARSTSRRTPTRRPRAARSTSPT